MVTLQRGTLYRRMDIQSRVQREPYRPVHTVQLNVSQGPLQEKILSSVGGRGNLEMLSCRPALRRKKPPRLAAGVAAWRGVAGAAFRFPPDLDGRGDCKLKVKLHQRSELVNFKGVGFSNIAFCSRARQSPILLEVQ
jgi:hypothetical protein